MNSLIMLMGIPGSGKSTLAENLVRKYGAVLVSSDAIRQEFTGSEEIFTREGQVFAAVHSRIGDLLAQGKNVVYDATNLTRSDRRKILKIVPPGIRKAVYYRKVPLLTAIRRNLGRKRRVPVGIILRMHQRLCEPTPAEGWDEVRVVTGEIAENQANLPKMMGTS